MESIIPVPAAMDMKGDLPQNWAFFKGQWENYCIATKLNEKEEKIRVATLLSVMGKECFRLFQNLDMPEENRKKEDQIKEALEKNFEPTRNVIYERYKFNTADQLPNESIDEYVTRLRHLSKSCDFGALTDDLICDRIVLGTKDAILRSRLLREPKLDLRGAIDKARNTEAAQTQLSRMAQPVSSESVHYSKKSREYKTKKPGQNKHKQRENKRGNEENMIKGCRFCGGTHPKGRDIVRHMGQPVQTVTKRTTLQKYVNKRRGKFTKLKNMTKMITAQMSQSIQSHIQ
ncbi:hypothetical protein HOLleu_27229 [Holothuria leucospilota]|uniref:Retrotransposon gag domain-containing protein n=1 Tax=Holothuria leucospilota TaxID=206669 RepID=A0A9Q1BQG9_HOLLE|nr:hypothetical protein HOLleu_27229 [Holothuria leucospilota]